MAIMAMQVTISPTIREIEVVSMVDKHAHSLSVTVGSDRVKVLHAPLFSVQALDLVALVAQHALLRVPPILAHPTQVLLSEVARLEVIEAELSTERQVLAPHFVADRLAAQIVDRSVVALQPLEVAERLAVVKTEVLSEDTDNKNVFVLQWRVNEGLNPTFVKQRHRIKTYYI